MADCGASGTAIDHAARALIGNSTNAAQKQIGSLLGHATLAGASVPLAAGARPDTLTVGGGGGDILLAAAAAHPQQHQQQPARALHHLPHHAAAGGPMQVGMMPNQMHHQQHMAVMQQQQQQQQQHMMMMMQQKHHYDQMVLQQQQQQAQVAMAQQQKESALEKAVEEACEDMDPLEEGNVQGATMEQLAAAWAEAQDDTDNRLDTNADYLEGNVKGASMEELAAAWAEAQEAYDATEDVVDPSDLYYNDQDATNTLEKPTYQFVNEVSAEQQQQQSVPDTNYMEQGLKHFDQGELAEAIRNFELELQVNNPDNSTAWRMLGKCHAENDQDREAILCLETAVDRDPYCAESMLALGVSYVNELNHAKALNILKEWITMNPNYAGMPHATHEDVYGDTAQENDKEFQELQSLLLQALDYNSSDAADVWEALGVAANVSRDYETAIEAFRKAIEARPNDYQLWNKLGATLANSNRSDEALPAYHKAIALKPKYARAWLNLAISHSNLKEFDEAARCYLQTLSLNPGAVHCWSYLRVALSCSERWDLIPFAASQNLEAFKEHYDFVSYS